MSVYLTDDLASLRVLLALTLHGSNAKTFLFRHHLSVLQEMSYVQIGLTGSKNMSVEKAKEQESVRDER